MTTTTTTTALDSLFAGADRGWGGVKPAAAGDDGAHDGAARGDPVRDGPPLLHRQR